MSQNDQDRKQMEEYKKNPGANLSDSVNRAMVGDLRPLAKGGCLTKIITLVIIVSVLLLLSYCSI